RDTATAILSATTRIAGHRSAYLKAAQTVEPLLDSLHLTRVKAAQQALDAGHANADAKDRNAIVSGVLALLAALGLAVFIAMRVARGVDSLVAYTGKITEGNLDARAPAVGGRELGQLAQVLDTMAGRLRQSRDALELRNAQLAASHGEILALGEMSSALQACLNVEEAAEVIKRFCLRSFPGDYGAVYLFQSSRNYLDAITTWGDRQFLSNFPPNDCWALRRGQTHRMTDARKDPQCAHAHQDAGAAARYCCIPMSAQGNVLGLVHLAFGSGHAADEDDRFGDEAGDMVLSALGKAIKESCRRNDLPCRFGGEEFTVVLGDIARDAAVQWGERLLAKVRKLEVKAGGRSVGRITISAGVAFYPDHGEDIETLLQAADAALYRAKDSGRDRLVVYEPIAVKETT